MISYAQNREDVVLARALSGSRGCYVDVGAASPLINSVTKHFYDLGWSGINVEPLELWHRQLTEQRPRDVNLNIGLGAEDGELDFFDVSDEASEESTFSAETADDLRARGLQPVVRQVPVTTLRAVCEEHVDRPIDFLKIDVEGFELPVVQGGDWDRFRPTVVVIESTRPATGEPTDPAVQSLMEDFGYNPVLFDGINWFYAQAGDAETSARLRAPANVLDGFEPYAVVELRETVAALEAALARERAEAGRRADAAQRSITSLEARLRELERSAAAAQHRAEVLHGRLDRAQLDLAIARHEATDAEMQFVAAREALEQALGGNE